MPVESSRTTKNKKITLPSGQTVLVPVITSITFIDPTRRGQETQFTIDNSGDGDREAHVDQVNGLLPVERIDLWKYLDPVRRGQETQMSIDNKTMGEDPPPYFINHERTHIVRYKGDSAEDWIESELIDELRVVDPVRRGQEIFYTLNNPQNDDDAQADPSDPDISDSTNGVDPPWRTDPFQNIVDFASEATPLLVVEVWMGVLEQHGTPFGAGDAPTSATANVGGYADSAVINTSYSPHESPTVVFSGWPSTATMSITVDTDTVPGPGNLSTHPIISGPCNATSKVNWTAGSSLDLGSTSLNQFYADYTDTKTFSYEVFTDTLTGGFFNPLDGTDTLFRNAVGVLVSRQIRTYDLTGATITTNPGTSYEVVYEVIGTFCDHPNEYACGGVHNHYEFMFPDTPAWPRPPFPTEPTLMFGFGVVSVLLREVTTA